MIVDAKIRIRSRPITATRSTLLTYGRPGTHGRDNDSSDDDAGVFTGKRSEKFRQEAKEASRYEIRP